MLLWLRRLNHKNLGFSVIMLSMREEQNLQEKRHQQDDRSGSADFMGIPHQYVKRPPAAGFTCKRGVERTRNQEAESSDQHEPGACFTDDLMEDLLITPQASYKETHYQTKQQISQD